MSLRPFTYGELQPGDMIVYVGLHPLLAATKLIALKVIPEGDDVLVKWIGSPKPRVSYSRYSASMSSPSKWKMLTREGET